MCGIAGFIGNSKNPQLTYKLITSLLEESQIRGIDAAGYWGAEKGNGSIAYHKEPIKASELVKKNVWKDLSKIDFNLFLAHARGASSGVGPPADNKNNHPFTSSCRSIGLVHNGRIPDVEYDVLIKKYEVFSKCDSEILLRIFEAGGIGHTSEESTAVVDEDIDEITAQRLMGLRDIWSFIDRGHMAVAIGERVDEDVRRLFLFRNRFRSLWLADVRKELGQIFFCSTYEIWNAAFADSGLNRIFKNRIKMVELPTEELWTITFDGELDIKKYDICATGRSMWKPEGDIIKIVKQAPVTSVFTKLDDNEEVIYASKKEHANCFTEAEYDEDFLIGGGKPQQPHWTDPTDSKWRDVIKEDINLDEGLDNLKATCASVKYLVDDFYTIVEKKLKDGTMSLAVLQELLQSMEVVELDMEGTLRLIGD